MDRYTHLLGMSLFAVICIFTFDVIYTMRDALRIAQADVDFCVVEMNNQLENLEDRVRLYLNVYDEVLQPELARETE